MTTKVQWAWAAGLFEGEGTATLARQGSSRKVRPQLVVQMTDKDVLTRFHEIVKHGAFYGPYTNRGDGKKPYKPIWMWVLRDPQGVTKVSMKFLPYLGQRRSEQIHRVLDVLNEPPNPNGST